MHEFCSNCIEGKCQQCEGYGWQFNLLTSNCETICGDGIVAGLEQCDDENDNRDDICNQCRCQEHCQICNEAQCLLCDVGWKFEFNKCIPICGDHLVIQGYEECEDGNIIPYDGCFECQYQCQDQCTDCKEICRACDTYEWKIENHMCYPICGDGYVVQGFEQCDDGNDIKYDGCYECQLQCDKYCIDCQEGICMKCELGRYVKMNTCEVVCGNRYYLENAEQCDDGNQDNNDGCDSACMLEIDWVCINTVNGITSCFYSRSPEFQLQLLPANSIDVQEVQLTFSQPMKRSPKVIGEILNFLQVLIPTMEDSQYAITKQLDKPILLNEATDAVITVFINLYVSIEHPILEISFINDPVISNYNLTLIDNKKTITLKAAGVLSQNKVRITQAAKSFNMAVMYCLISIASICLLTGSADLFWNLMDQLQYLSYLKYINIQFPNNVNIYFEVFKLVTITPALEALRLDKLFAILDGEKEYFIQTSNKFLSDDINAYLFINIQSFIFYFISTFLLYQLTKSGYLLLYRIEPCKPCKLNLFVSKIYNKLMIISKEIKSFHYNGLLRIMMSSCYDLSFAAAIQLCYYNNEDQVLRINYYVAIIVYLVQFGLPIFFMGIIQRFAKKTTIQKKKKYETLFEDIHQSQPSNEQELPSSQSSPSTIIQSPQIGKHGKLYPSSQQPDQQVHSLNLR